jgi:hypothetical protein
MSIAITSQPATNSLNAAYRPVMITVSITPAAPVMYCDIYFADVFYKTISKTQGTYFDIQDAAKEYLKKVLAPRGGTAIINAAALITKCYVKVRSSTITDGFLVPDAPIPVQGTATTAPVSGGGTQSNTFYIVNSALQHIDNQDYPQHLSFYKTGTWGSGTFPLTHRSKGYQVNKGGSDYFPIISDTVPSGLTLHYHLRSTGEWLSISGGSGPSDPPPPDPVCVPVAITGTPVLPDGQVGVAYNYSIALTGDTPYTLSSIVKPSWMNINVVGSNIVLSGTPIAPGASIAVSFTVNNACGTDDVSDTVDISAAPPAINVVSNNITEPTRVQTFSVGDSVTAGNKFYVEVYSHHVEVTAVDGDTPATIAAKLVNAVNAQTESDWDTEGSAPATGTPGFKPFAQYPGTGSNFSIELNSANQFAAGATVS